MRHEHASIALQTGRGRGDWETDFLRACACELRPECVAHARAESMPKANYDSTNADLHLKQKMHMPCGWVVSAKKKLTTCMRYRSSIFLQWCCFHCVNTHINSPRASGAVIEVLNESYDMAGVPKPYKYPITEAEWVTPSPVNSATCRCQYLQPILVLDDFSTGQE